MKKLFGGINLTWKKLVIFALLAGSYTALMALLPITYETSFRDIAIQLEWWILFGIIIICNSKSPLDSALKCFVFFLISQPLVYLIQVPFAEMGWGLFKFYKYWFILTLLCFPMGFVGYYINKRNWISVIILMPMLLLLGYLGLGYLSNTMEAFPHHLLSCISCFAIILVVVLNLFKDKKYKIVTLSIVVLSIIIYIVLRGGIFTKEYEVYRTLDSFDIVFEGDINVSYFKGYKKGNAEIASSSEEIHSVRLLGLKGATYEFGIKDDSENEYEFKYYYDEEHKTVQLDRVK